MSALVFHLFTGEETHTFQGLFDQSFSIQGDCFGDEEMQLDLIGRIEVNTSIHGIYIVCLQI